MTSVYRRYKHILVRSVLDTRYEGIASTRRRAQQRSAEGTYGSGEDNEKEVESHCAGVSVLLKIRGVREQEI